MLSPPTSLRHLGHLHGAAVAGALFAAAAATLTAALAFEHLGGYVPCALCLTQRYAYYTALPLSALALVLFCRNRASAGGILLSVLAVAFLINAALGVYQAGAEWKLWEGPASCSGAQALTTSAKDLLESLATARVVRCDEASWRFAGLSFAGWNAVLSTALAGAALWGAWAAWRPRR